MKNKKENKSDFIKQLEFKQQQQAKAALISTVRDNYNYKIGELYDLLEMESSGDFLMLEIFRNTTIEELAIEVWDEIAGSDGPGEHHDEDQILVQGSEDEILEESQPKPKRKKKGKKKKKKPQADADADADADDSQRMPPKKKRGRPAKDSKNATSAPLEMESYKTEIRKHLRSSKALDPARAMSSAEIREAIGGEPDEFRSAIAEMKESGTVKSCGKARGTKYHL